MVNLLLAGILVEFSAKIDQLEEEARVEAEALTEKERQMGRRGVVTMAEKIKAWARGLVPPWIPALFQMPPEEDQSRGARIQRIVLEGVPFSHPSEDRLVARARGSKGWCHYQIRGYYPIQGSPS